MSLSKLFLVLAASAGAAAVPCIPCGPGVPAVRAQEVRGATQATDTVTVRLHISGMTCGSCPTTARLALKRLAGVYSATVTLDDSLGVVRYDQRKLVPTAIAAHLKRMTGFRATILPDTTAGSARPGHA